MPGPQFLSKLTAKRFTRTSSVDIPYGEDEQNAVHEYKKCMEEIKRENPHLSIGAQRQMTLKRCAKMHEDQEEGCGHSQKHFSLTGELLRGVMTKLHLGSQSSLGPTVGSSTQASDFAATFAEDRHRSLAPCKSVKVSREEQNNVLAQMDWSESENQSLEDSLENIEKSVLAKSLDRRSRRTMNNSSMRYSRRLSGVSLELSYVEEDAELKDSDTAERGANNEDKNTNPSVYKANSESISDFLPDEIAVVLGNFDDANDEEKNFASPGQGRRKSRASRLHQHSIKSSINSHRSNADESHNSSHLFGDSANFAGDFWAWRSFSSRNTRSS